MSIIRWSMPFIWRVCPSRRNLNRSLMSSHLPMDRYSYQIINKCKTMLKHSIGQSLPFCFSFLNNVLSQRISHLYARNATFNLSNICQKVVFVLYKSLWINMLGCPLKFFFKVSTFEEKWFLT